MTGQCGHLKPVCSCRLLRWWVLFLKKKKKNQHHLSLVSSVFSSDLNCLCLQEKLSWHFVIFGLQSLSFHRIDRLSSASGRPIQSRLCSLLLCVCVCVFWSQAQQIFNHALLDLTEDTEDEPELLNLVLELAVLLRSSLPCYWVHFNQGSALSFESLRRVCA